MAYLSISIDLSGSTLVKQALVEFSDGDEKKRSSLYYEYTKLLYEIERTFYLRLMKHSQIDFSKLFLVKTIGDEYWYFYEVEDHGNSDHMGVASVFFDELINLFSVERYLAYSSSTPGLKSFPGQETGLPVKEFDLPIKAFIDLIKEPIEVNAERYEYLKDVIGILRGNRSTLYAIDQAYIEICNRLNLGSPDILKDAKRLSVRKDFIGLEVDRFFRLTKFCKSHLLGVGETLIGQIAHSVEPVGPRFEHIGVQKFVMGRSDNSRRGTSENRIYVISENIPAASMKGISKDYTVHHLFTRTALGDSVYAPPPSVETLMGPTRAFLAENGFYALEREGLVS